MNRLCVHTMTTKPWSLDDCARHYPAKGVHAITVWRQHLEGRDSARVGSSLRDAGLEITSLCRGGFFPASNTRGLLAAIDENLKIIEQAHALKAPLIVLVCGAVPGQSLVESRKQIADGIAAILPAAEQAGVKLAIEPLHPMYADDRSAVNTMRQAHEICHALGSPKSLGIAVDVYHVWWDRLLAESLPAARGRVLGYHLSDWLETTRHMLLDRGMMGDGVADLRAIRAVVEDGTGYTGLCEVEIFSAEDWWKRNPADVLDVIVDRFRRLC